MDLNDLPNGTKIRCPWTLDSGQPCCCSLVFWEKAGDPTRFDAICGTHGFICEAFTPKIKTDEEIRAELDAAGLIPIPPLRRREYDEVDPEHYDARGEHRLEFRDVAALFLEGNPHIDPLVAADIYNVLKYYWRLGRKGPVPVDLAKAARYAAWAAGDDPREV